jgi:hypothetical protein
LPAMASLRCYWMTESPASLASQLPQGSAQVTDFQ